MQRLRSRTIALVIALLLALSSHAAHAQDVSAAFPAVLTGAELERVVPTSFYYEGLSAATQMRNAAAARLGKQHLVIAGLVDTSGYSSEVQAKYQGFLITDAPISFRDGTVLGIGAYGFGFSGNRFNILDIAGHTLMSVEATTDRPLLRPRPLSMTKAERGIRLYAGRTYVEFSAETTPEL